MENITLYNDDCFNVFSKIEDKSIDLFVLDLPFGVTACSWDICIDLDKMWIEIKRIMKPSAIICFFCTTKFGYTLIKSNEKWYRYDLIWAKSRRVGFLSSGKRQLRAHENIYVFNNDNNDDIEIKRNIELRKYAEKVKEYINKTKTDIVKECGQGLDHFLRISSSQFALPIEKNYKKLIELYKIDKMQGFLKYKDMVEKWEKIPAIPHTYHPQKTKGKPYKTGEHNNAGYYYKDGNYKRTANDNKGDRHPTSIIEHENIYVFNNDDNHSKDDKEIKRNIELRKYAEKVKEYINKPLKQITKDIGNMGLHHFYAFKSSQFEMLTEKTYKKLIELYKIDKMKGFLKYKDMLEKWEKNPISTYNPQKLEGKPYKTNRKTETNVYGTIKLTNDENKGDRHPTSIIENTILKYNNPHKTIHRTEKPIGLLEYLIKTYSNKGDVVMDFTAGSLTCGIACLNTNRKFIGVEMNKEIFELGLNRIVEYEKNINKNIIKN